MTADTEARLDEHAITLIREALRFAVWAAGEGFMEPEEFLFQYSCAAGLDDWEPIPDSIASLLRAALARKEG